MDLLGKAASLSKMIFEENLRGAVPNISSADVNRVPNGAMVPVSEKYDRFIACTSHMFPRLGEAFQKRNLWAGGYGWLMQAALGSEESLDGAARGEVEMLFEEALRIGHVYRVGTTSSEFRLSYAGHRYVDELGVALSNSEKIFVAMWFGSAEQTALYEEAIAPAIRDAGYIAVRIDNTEHNEKIDDQIIAEIRKSKAVVVDLTCGLATPENWSTAELVGSPRGGVFF